MTFLLLALAGGALILWLYGRREIPVSGRWLLASARVISLGLLLLLLWNPSIPRASDADAEERPWLLLDASLSMTAGEPEPWPRALEKAGAGEWEGVLAFGDEPGSVGADGSAGPEPGALRSRLGPALERVAASGGREVVVASDFRLEDGATMWQRARSLGLAVRPDALGTELVNAGVAEVSFPSRARSGVGLSASVVVFSEGLGATDSLEIRVREEERLVAAERISAPEAGRLRRLNLDLRPPGGVGARRYFVTVTAPRDAFPDDDGRPAWVDVDPGESGVLLVSFRPDWEPRFLLPVLERVTGLPGEAFLEVGGGRFMTSAGEGRGPRMLSREETQRALGRATILVVHGLERNAPEWAARAIDEAPRAVVFAADRAGAALAGLAVGSILPGEWYPASPPPPSPMAGELAGVDLSRLPPLTGVLPMAGGTDAALPLMLGRRGRGPEEAALALLERGGRRRVVVLGQGLWRWGFREGSGREAYERLWAGAAGWLLGGHAPALGSEIRPRARVVRRGDPVLWQAPRADTGRLRVRIRTAGDSLVFDGTVVPDSAGFSTGTLPPGVYSFRAERSAEPGTVLGEGRFEVELFSDELMTLPVPVGGDDGPPSTTPSPRRDRRPLRTHPLPYLVVLGLLCAEWIGRRRKGLR